MGASVGFISGNDFSAGSFNWAFLTGTTEKPYGPPTELSALWSYNPKTDVLAPQWVNTDGSTPKTISYAFLITGDATAFRNTFGSPFPLITFTCVPPKHTQYL
ncbi:hypothetical protein B0J17DRAFT_660795 [Rhizoctonia solani]|nr:hypothetical protein B0J17DRAFT_660795 [Rhizoctonia solani]